MPGMKSGKNQVLLFRALKDAEAASARKLVYQTEHSVDKSTENEEIPTKDGVINVSGEGTEEISFSSNWAVEDEGETMEMLEDTYDNKEILEMWEVDLDSPGTEPNTYKGKYRQGKLNDFSYSAPADGQVEVEMTYRTNANAVKGIVTLSAAQETAIQYAFRDVAPEVPEA